MPVSALFSPLSGAPRCGRSELPLRGAPCPRLLVRHSWLSACSATLVRLPSGVLALPRHPRPSPPLAFLFAHLARSPCRVPVKPFWMVRVPPRFPLGSPAPHAWCLGGGPLPVPPFLTFGPVPSGGFVRVAGVVRGGWAGGGGDRGFRLRWAGRFRLSRGGLLALAAVWRFGGRGSTLLSSGLAVRCWA